MSPYISPSCLFRRLLCQIICHPCVQILLHFHSLFSFLYDCLVSLTSWIFACSLPDSACPNLIKELVSCILILCSLYFFGLGSKLLGSFTSLKKMKQSISDNQSSRVWKASELCSFNRRTLIFFTMAGMVIGYCVLALY